MLNKLRNFTKTKLATVLIGIIIIPFVFWGMGGVFQGGNTNNIAKIKNVNISTEDFFDHIRSLGINEEIISKNIENNILTEILNEGEPKESVGCATLTKANSEEVPYGAHLVSAPTVFAP